MLPEDRNPVIREWNEGRDARRYPPGAPIHRPSDPLRWFILFTLTVALLLVLALLVSPAGAAERRTSVVIEAVRGDAGFYVVRLDTGAILVITPPRRAPQLQPGAALMDSSALWQSGWRYAISRKAVKR